ncbi:MAG: efflux transporter outer membrane subunit [Gammaproteobacteria bacterium]|nr:efflux transporter outer membrane subunit [Gammaproteobacteria bacterium]
MNKEVSLTRLRHLLLEIVCLSGVTSLMLTGCAVGPDFHQQAKPQTKKYTKLPLPHKTINTPQNSNAGKAQQFVNGSDLQGDWWRIFHSSQLNALVAQGLLNNQNLAAAKAALREANDTLYAQAGGLLLPHVDMSGIGEAAQTSGLAYGVNSTPSVFNVYNTNFQATYLLDIWGASRRQVEAYAAQADYQRYEMLGVYLTLTTNIVTTSITIASLQEQIKATINLISEQQKVWEITKKQLAAGGVSVENVLTQQTLLAQTQATLPPLQKSLSEEQHALTVLVGKETSDAKPLSLSLNKITLPKNLPLSLPSSMVVQRPDIQASEALLHVTSAQVGVATANLLPQITLSAATGWLSTTTTDFFSSANQTWNYGMNLMQPLFHGGQLIMQRKAAIEALNQARAQYEQTVLQAFKNVADALRAIQYDADEFNKQTHAEKTAYETFYLTQKQYQVGGQNYLSVLQAEEKYQQTVISTIKAQAARYADTAALYQSLGGGWWHNPFISHYDINKLKLGSQFQLPQLQLPQPGSKN